MLITKPHISLLNPLSSLEANLPPTRLTYSVIYSSRTNPQFWSINSLNPKTSFWTKTLYVFGESATNVLERATTEIRQGMLMKP